MGAILDGIGNIFSGGTWRQSGGELASQDWNAYQAQLARDFSSLEAEKARLFSSVEAQKNRDFQEYMSNTAYSRAFQDMKSVGLNPYLMSSGASTPSGTTAQTVSAQSERAGGSFARKHSDQVTRIISVLANTALGMLSGGVASSAAKYSGTAIGFRS